MSVEIYTMYEHRFSKDKPQLFIKRKDSGAVEIHINKRLSNKERNPALTFMLKRHPSGILSGRQAQEWIKSRVWDEQYQLLPEVLRNAGLTSYDPWKLFLASKGRHARDNMFIAESQTISNTRKHKYKLAKLPGHPLRMKIR